MQKLFDKNKNQSVWQDNNGRHYLCSTSTVTRDPEVMVFRCCPRGVVTDWCEIYAGYSDTTNHAHHMEIMSKVGVDSFHLKTF